MGEDAKHFDTEEKEAHEQRTHALKRAKTSIRTELGEREISNAEEVSELREQHAKNLKNLRLQFEEEVVEDFACEACTLRGPCNVRKPVTHWPPILFLHLKRLVRDDRNRPRKIKEHFFFEDRFQSEALGCSYSLQAVAVHTGQDGRGHYTAFVLDSQGRWLEMNDAMPPHIVSFQKVARAKAYLLVYRRVPE